jgi:ribosomal protein L37AE/L43A
MAENPFAGPFGAGGPFADKSNGQDPATADVIKCPVCKAQNFDARQNQWETWRVCRDCGNKWSGGVIGVAKDDIRIPPPPAGMAAPDEDDFPEQDLTPDYRKGSW